MNPIKHGSSNIMVSVPANWDDRGGKLRIPALPATRGKVSGFPVVVTYWEPTAEEIAILLAGGTVQLTCLGGQPACNISAIPPNEQGLSILLPN